MEPAREHAFAGAGFAQDQYRAFGGKNLPCLIRQRTNRRAGPDKRIDRLAHLARLAGELFVMVTLFLKQSLQNDEKSWELERLG